ncbi:MAG: hypothetical protein II649_07005 [Kiritimatiellae bacterium]|nr:hypothetical protein [Kiritimatiellia bacterium]
MSTVEQANWERDCVAYMRTLADHCKNCLRTYNCPNCDIATAKALLRRKDEIGMRHTTLIDKPKDPNSLKARYREILTILRKAGKPLRARDIVLRTTKSRNVKWWTLNRMVNKGMIWKTRVKNFYGRYEAAYYTKGKKQ